MNRQVLWDTLPDAITRTPHPPKPTEADLELCPTCVYSPRPNKAMCEYGLRWGDAAYGLTPPPAEFTEHIPDTTISRLEIATDALIRAAATHRNLPLESSQQLLDALDGLIRTMEAGRNNWNMLLDTYDPERVEFTHGRECNSARTHRPTQAEVRSYSDRLNAMGERLRQTLDRVSREIHHRSTVNRPADGYDRQARRRPNDQSRGRGRRYDAIQEEEREWPLEV